MKNNASLCYPKTWRELKSARFDDNDHTKPTLISMHIVWLLANPDQDCVEACGYDLPMGVNLFRLNMNAVNNGTISIHEFDFVEDRGIVEWDQGVLSMVE